MTLVIDSELQISRTDKDFFNSLASKTGQLQGNDLTNFVHPDDQAHLRFQVQYCCQNNCALSSTLRMTIDNNYYAWFQLKAQPLAEPHELVQLSYSFLQYEQKTTANPNTTLQLSKPGTVLFSNGFPPSIRYTSSELGYMRSISYHQPLDIILEIVDVEHLADDQKAIESALEKADPLHLSYNDQHHGQQYHLQLTPVLSGSSEQPEILLQHYPVSISQSDNVSPDIRHKALLTTNNPHPIIQVSSDGIIEFYNAPACDLMQYWGVSQGQYIPNELINYLIKDQSVSEKSLEVTVGDAIYEGVIRPHGNNHYCFYLVDITEEKENQQKLKRQQQLLSSINQHIEEGIFRSTPEDGLIYVNEPFARLFGYESAANILAADSSGLYANPEDRRHMIREEQANGGLKNRPVKFKRKDGSTFWGLLSSNRLLDDHGNVFYDGALRDITHEIKVQKQLEEAKQEAEELDRLKSHFLANMSHEVRTPLNGILGLVQLMEKEYQTEDKITEYTRMIRYSGERLLKTLNSIIAFSRLETGKVPQATGSTDIAQSLPGLLKSYEREAQQHGLAFYQELQSYIPPIAVTQEIFQHIVQNIIDNSLKFTSKGYIVIRTGLNFQKNKALITVADTGIGIEGENQERIFNAFYQESLGHKREYEGPGLGLPIVQRFCHLCGGSLKLKSRKNRGTVVQIGIPLVKSNS